ncbi:XRE family transcriptional regulator [Ferrovibrio sp.]|uniref:helix-turn-helix domain-containing protein n=1 Tax=Ferrovibrio sp. TaxID=1917215 RepID=UPI00262A7AEA|nr:XRE family transcriptional regulator [Ferrovibrio sp.]
MIEKLNEPDQIEARIAGRLKARREALDLTLDQLAERAGVSRAMISRIERQESSPTAAVLGRLCAGLDITLSGLMAAIEDKSLVLLPREAQPQWRDPETGFERRAVTPAGTGSMVEIVEGRLPPGARIAYPLPADAYDQHILGQEGILTFESGPERFAIHAGDCLHCTLGQPHAFANETQAPCRYLIIIARRRPS